jgi:MFS family permease
LKGYDYNEILSIFYISYIVFEIPANIVCKLVGPGWFIPATALGFGCTTVACAYTHTKAQIAGVRFVLGIFEAGMLPGIAYYLSRWYRRKELVWRLALYVVAAPIAGAFSGLLASGILTLDHVAGVHQWRMIFLVEGIITIGLSCIAFFTLTDRPETARWLTPAERELAIARIKSERVGQTALLDRVDTKKLKRGIFNPVVLATAVIFFFDNVTVQGLAFFAPSIIKTIYPHHSVVQQQLRTVPPYIVGAVGGLGFAFASMKRDRRIFVFLMSAPCVMIGYIMYLASTNPHVRYGASFIIAFGAFTAGAQCNAHVSANVVSDTSRAAGIGTNVMFGNLGGLVATWAFLPFDAPNYMIGNGLNLATSSSMLLIAIALYFWQPWDNKKRDRKDIDAELSGLSQAEIEDLDWKHPAFRWKP